MVRTALRLSGGSIFASCASLLRWGLQAFDSWLPSEAEIERFETELKFSLPDDYKAFMVDMVAEISCS
ncbi:SMI1/KNR4 family protein [Amycolatopsis sp. NPDC004368]